MTELQAGQGRSARRTSGRRIDALSRRPDRARRLRRAGAACRCSPRSKFLLDFVIRCAAYGLFATSLNLLVGYTGLTSFGHGMFFGLGAYGFGLIDAEDRRADSRRLRRHAADHAGGRDRDRRDLRAAEGNLFRLRHAGVSDADPLHDPVLGVVHRRRPGPARRHSAADIPRHRSFQPSASLYLQLRAAGDRPALDAPDRAVAVRLHACA